MQAIKLDPSSDISAAARKSYVWIPFDRLSWWSHVTAITDIVAACRVASIIATYSLFIPRKPHFPLILCGEWCCLTMHRLYSSGRMNQTFVQFANVGCFPCLVLIPPWWNLEYTQNQGPQYNVGHISASLTFHFTNAWWNKWLAMKSSTLLCHLFKS